MHVSAVNVPPIYACVCPDTMQYIMLPCLALYPKVSELREAEKLALTTETVRLKESEGAYRGNIDKLNATNRWEPYQVSEATFSKENILQ